MKCEYGAMPFAMELGIASLKMAIPPICAISVKLQMAPNNLTMDFCTNQRSREFVVQLSKLRKT